MKEKVIDEQGEITALTMRCLENCLKRLTVLTIMKKTWEKTPQKFQRLIVRSNANMSNSDELHNP